MQHFYATLVGLFFMTSAFGQTTAEEYYDAGKVHYKAEEWQAAIDDFTKAIELGYAPLDRAYYDRGICYHYLSNYEKAISDYNQALTLKPTYSYALTARGTSQHALGNTKEAISDYTTSIQINSNNAFAYFSRGFVKEQQGLDAEALADYNKAIELKPDYTRAINDRKNLLERMSGSSSQITISAQAPKVWAVAVGIERYQNTAELSDLEYAENHVYNFARIVERKDFIQEVVILTDTEATKNEIVTAIENTLIYNNQIKEDDLVMFYYSGHGMALDDKLGICPYDYFGLEAFLSEDEIIDLMKRSRAKHKVCFIEACKSKNNALGAIPDGDWQTFNNRRKAIDSELVYITSTKSEADSYEMQQLRSGVFSYYLLEAISGRDTSADRNGDNILTVKEIFDYLQTKVSEKTNNLQVPQINTAGYKDIPVFILGR